ncbi:MAG: putative O-methyltransferase YrrM [Lysobacterales bacterium]
MNRVKSIIRKFPVIRDLIYERDKFHKELVQLKLEHEKLTEANRHTSEELNHTKIAQGFVPPGHFYSPIPDFEEIKKNATRIFNSMGKVPGIELNADSQRELLEKFLPFYKDIPFTSEAKEGLRYKYENPAYSYSDAIFLHCMIRFLEPKRIIEVGSGYSSCMTLDTNELHFENRIKTTFIEPYPKLLHSLLKDGDQDRITIIPERLQDVNMQEFSALQANDILFIDSTHVSKIDSDVNKILFEILPALASGVYIHFHDIFFPFEYPMDWVLEGRAWNEAYALRAFLQYNREFNIVLMNSYIGELNKEFFTKKLPLCQKNPGGSIWLKRQ